MARQLATYSSHLKGKTINVESSHDIVWICVNDTDSTLGVARHSFLIEICFLKNVSIIARILFLISNTFQKLAFYNDIIYKF